MKVNIAIDQGNTWAKVGIFAGGKLVEVRHYEELQPADIEEISRDHEVARAIYSTVRVVDEAVTEAVRRVAERVVELSHLTPMPLVIDYATPATLGHDRIAAAVGAVSYYAGSNCLVVDAGTAVTLDVVTAGGHFVGGRISPGVRMRLEALHRYTSRLPLVEAYGDTPIVGYDTATAIRSGVVRGVASEIESCCHRLRGTLGDGLRVILTGGDARLLADLVEGCEVTVDDNILMKGLNRILQYNEDI